MEGRRGERQRPGAERPEARAEDLVECSVHGKKRSWDKIEVTAEKKWVCVASCPCVVHLGGTKGWCHFLRDALRSRGEEPKCRLTGHEQKAAIAKDIRRLILF